MSYPPLTLLLGAESLIGRRSGIGRMTLQIAQTLRHDPRLAEIRLLLGTKTAPVDAIDALEADEPQPGESGRLGKVVNSVLRLGMRLGSRSGLTALRRAWLRRQLDRHINSLNANGLKTLVYHEPNMIARPFNGPTVITINDLSWHHDRSLHPVARVRWIDRGLPRTLRQARRIVAISAFTKSEIVRELGVAPDMIDVVLLAPAAVFRPASAEAAAATLAQHGLSDRGYILSVSTLEPRKNFDGLLAAFLKLPPRLRERVPLAIAGGAGWGSTLENSDAQRAIAAGQLRLLGYASDEALAMLYARAACFAFVSHYEGFGLPVIEAMASGTPVVASSTTAVGETAGDAAALVDPADHTAIAEALARVLDDSVFADGLRTAGLQRATRFTWAKTADRLIDVWHAALAA
jgi:glycosyltransferase involved in cell wall biosynthesis